MRDLIQIARDHWNRKPNLNGIAKLRSDLTGCNKKFSIRDDGIEWLIKICDGWGISDPRSVRDLNEREELFCILAKANGVPVVDCWRIDTRTLRFEPTIQWKPNDILQKGVASKFVHAARCPACDSGRFNESQLVELSNVLAFCHWIGDEDRGVEDILWIEGRPCLIDQSLSGPPSHILTKGNECRGTHFQREDRQLFSHEQVLKKCPSGKASLVAHLLRYHKAQLPRPTVLDLIKQTDLSDLAQLVKYYSMPDLVAKQLVDRLDTLDADFWEWQSEAQKLLF